MNLVISRVVKFILAIVVVAAVVTGFYLFFKPKVIDLFKGISGSNSTKLFLSLLR